MRKRNFTLLILSLCFLTVHSQEDVSASRWLNTPIVVDGNDNDWEPLNFFDNTSGMIFTMGNDGKNIYLCFSNNDRAHAAKMMAAGWSVELSSSEKKRKFDVTLSFPKETDPAISAQADMKNIVASYRSKLPGVEAKGLLSNTASIPLNAKQGIGIAIGSDSTDKIVYEINIPVNELMEADKLQLNELITVNISVNALDKPATQSSSNGSQGARGTGGMHGGGMRGGGGGRGGGGFNGHGGGNYSNSSVGNRASMFEKTSFKQKIHLVAK